MLRGAQSKLSFAGLGGAVFKNVSGFFGGKYGGEFGGGMERLLWGRGRG